MFGLNHLLSVLELFTADSYDSGIASGYMYVLDLWGWHREKNGTHANL